MNTYEQLSSLWSSIPEDARNITLQGYALVLVASILAALLIAHMYKRFFDAKTTGSRIHRSFPILAPAITTIFITVQYSLPLSLGLLGALSIVRFRTPIKEPEEIGFILLVIASSISISTFNISFAAILYIIVYACLFLRTKLPGGLGLQTDTSDSLNIMINNEIEGSGMNRVKEISAYLDDSNIQHRIASLQITDRGISVSALMWRQGKADLDFLESLESEFQDVQFDYYQQ